MGCFISCFGKDYIEYKEFSDYSDSETDNLLEYPDSYNQEYEDYFDTVYRRRFYGCD